MLKFAASLALSTTILFSAAPAVAGGQVGSKDLSKCRAGGGPAVLVNVTGVKESTGKMRVQTYRGIESEWLKTGAWLYRVEAPAKAGNMQFCLPVPSAGTYAVAIRHDVNANGKTDIFGDGGGMSNNPSINIFNLGKPSYKKTAFSVGNDVKSINISMKYR
jgi:uncharacterized protein (DUF2141 family)